MEEFVLIPAQYYRIIYFAIVSCATLYVVNAYNGNLSGEKRASADLAQKLMIILAIFIGLRPIDGVFVDMTLYAGDYEIHKYNFEQGTPLGLTLFTENKIFDNLERLFPYFGIPFFYFMLLLSILYFGGIFYAVKKLFKEDVFMAFITYLGALSTYSFGVNGMKNGVAGSFILLALAYRDKVKWSIFYALVSYGFHHAMELPVVAYLCTFYKKNTKLYIYFWFFCLLVSALHITFFQTIFSRFTTDHGAEYLDESKGGFHTGFRIDFVVYSAFPILIAYINIIKKNLKDRFYITISNTYILANAVWLLCMYANFTNRIAYLSWIILPIVIVYPYLRLYPYHNRKNKETLTMLIIGQLLFTILMSMR